MSVPDGIVVPRSSIPRTLGILHIIFGTLLILAGTCILGISLALPAIGATITQVTGQQAQAAQARYQERLKALEDEEKAAPDEETKKTLKAERDAMVASPPIKPNQPDLSPSFDQFKNPTIRNTTVADKLTGIALNIALIVAGVGLVRSREWGRRLGVQVAAVQLVRLVILAVVYLVLVLPVQQAESEKIFKRLEDQIKQGGGAGAANTIQMGRVSQQLAPLFLLGYYIPAAIYPVVSLILLQTRAARAACLVGEPKSPPDAGGLL